MAVDFLDRYSRGSTWCHRWPARLKIVLTLAVIVAVVLLPISLWPIHGCLACLIFAAHAVADIPLSYLLRRVALLLPVVLLMALCVPLSRGFSGGWELASALVARALLTFLAALWLVNTTPFDRLLAAFRQLGMPRSFVVLLAFTYRYLFVVFDELARMRTAQRARTFGRRSPWAVWNSTVQLVAMLLIRSLNRSERVHQAMLSRGWQGEFRTID
ncbi:MAG: cobalt ECF transporter T component CbiQ [Planctomycetaceae bacterium]|nr:cobalt ECF transporter T component CbiQ [Planctomycetaceae bacterium]